VDDGTDDRSEGEPRGDPRVSRDPRNRLSFRTRSSKAFALGSFAVFSALERNVVRLSIEIEIRPPIRLGVSLFDRWGLFSQILVDHELRYRSRKLNRQSGVGALDIDLLLALSVTCQLVTQNTGSQLLPAVC
jgi:hypothetical protein